MNKTCSLFTPKKIEGVGKKRTAGGGGKDLAKNNMKVGVCGEGSFVHFLPIKSLKHHTWGK